MKFIDTFSCSQSRGISHQYYNSFKILSTFEWRLRFESKRYAYRWIKIQKRDIACYFEININHGETTTWQNEILQVDKVSKSVLYHVAGKSQFKKKNIFGDRTGFDDVQKWKECTPTYRFAAD